MKRLAPHILSLTIILAVILLDMVTKGYLLYLLNGAVVLSGNAFDVVANPVMFARVTNWFNVVFTWNPGTSFSMFQNLGVSVPLAIIVITAFIIGFLGYYLFARQHQKMELVSLAFIVGGAAGNLIDRLRFGAVVDFLDLHIGAAHWPAFNVADSVICIGVILLIVSWIIGKKQ